MASKFFDQRNEVQTRAENLARLGIPLFACGTDKRPLTAHGFKDATTERSELWGMFADPGALIGMPCGERSGLSVLDLDLTRHPEACAWFDTHMKRLPRTLMVTTRSGGVHLFFRHRVGVKNSAGKIAVGVDTRGQGGYVILWEPDSLITALAKRGWPSIAKWPTLLEPAPKPTTSPPERHPARLVDRYQVRVLRAFVTSSRAGERNNRLHWAACRLAELDGVTSADEDSLINAGVEAGLSRDECTKTVASAFGRSIA